MEQQEVKATQEDPGSQGEGSGDRPRLRRTKGDGDGETSQLRVSVPHDLSVKLRAAMQELRARGASISAEDLLGGFWGKVGDSYIAEEITRFTPEDYYLEAARKIPELRERLIQQAKKALSVPTAGLRKPGRKKRELNQEKSGGVQNEAHNPRL